MQTCDDGHVAIAFADGACPCCSLLGDLESWDSYPEPEELDEMLEMLEAFQALKESPILLAASLEAWRELEEEYAPISLDSNESRGVRAARTIKDMLTHYKELLEIHSGEPVYV